MSLRPLKTEDFICANLFRALKPVACCRRGLRGRHAAPAIRFASPCRLADSPCHQQLGAPDGAPDDASSFEGSSQRTEMCIDRPQDSKGCAEDSRTITGTMGLPP